MSRSYLHDPYKRKLSERNCLANGKHSVHQEDEEPKNRVSKFVSTHGGSNADWLQDTPSFSSHKRIKGGHRMVSGIVRANVKEEIREELDRELTENE